MGGRRKFPSDSNMMPFDSALDCHAGADQFIIVKFVLPSARARA